MSYLSKDAYEVPGKLEIPYRYYAGKAGSIFLTTLRDHKKIMGARCGRCNIVFTPPRSVCNACYRRIDEWKQVGPAGTVVTCTVVRYSEPHLAAKPPYALALIKLDGADTALAHIVSEIPPEQVKIGMRVEPVFAEKRNARITDIAYFRPLVAETKKTTRKAAPKKAAAKKAGAKKAGKKAAAKKTAARPGPKPKKKAAKKTAAKKAVKKTVRKKPEIKKQPAGAKKTTVKRAGMSMAGRKKTAKKFPGKKKTAKKLPPKKKAAKKTAKKKK